jgi:hypothetical protein
MIEPASVIVLGTSKSGKTSYISVLQEAAHFRNECSIIPVSSTSGQPQLPNSLSGAASLFRQGREAILYGHFFEIIRGTNNSTEYIFDLTVQLPDLPSRGWLGTFLPKQSTVSQRFSFRDGPGGWISPDEEAKNDPHLSKMRAAWLNDARAATSLLLCLDATDQAAAGQLFIDLPTLLDELGRGQKIFDRVAIVMTKAEKIPCDKPSAYSELARMDPVSCLLGLMQFGLRNLFNYLRPNAQVACGFASVFGFVRDEWTPNLKILPGSNQEVMRLFTNPNVQDLKRLQVWVPFRVLDPLIFLTCGNLGDMRLVTEAHIAAALSQGPKGKGA